MIIIMLGAPGTGKGTVGKLLSEEFDIPHISSGEIFRSYINKQSKLAKEIGEYVSKGLLVPDDLSIKLLEKRLCEDDVENGAILDGFPRTNYQADILEKMLKKQEKSIKIAIELSLPDEEIIDRIVKRRTCSNKDCREIYNLEFKIPKKEGVCDKCGAELIIREDDNEKTVKQRLKTYHETSEHLIDFYKNKDILYTVRINSKSDDVSKEVAKEIEEYIKRK